MPSYPSLLTKLLIIAGFLASCGPTLVNVPRETDETSLASVFFYSSSTIESSGWAIDGVQQGIFDVGLTVAPGEHRAQSDFQFESEACRWGDTLCFEVTSYGICAATFTVAPGQSYAVRISRSTDSVFMSVENEKNGTVAGFGNCRVTRTASRSTRGTLKIH